MLFDSRLSMSPENVNNFASGTPVIEADSKPLHSSADILKLLETTVETMSNTNIDENLACPFWKHNPLRYKLVNNACTDGIGFKDIGKLMEHMRRVHSGRFGCPKCRKRFTKCKIEDVDREKAKHNCCSAERDETSKDHEPEWMDKDQEAKFQRLNFQRDKGPPQECWNKICEALFGRDSVNQITGHNHAPGYHVSLCVFLLERGLRKATEIKMKECGEEMRNIVGPPASSYPQSINPVALSEKTIAGLPVGPPPFYRGQSYVDSGLGTEPWGTLDPGKDCEGEMFPPSPIIDSISHNFGLYVNTGAWTQNETRDTPSDYQFHNDMNDIGMTTEFPDAQQ
ncbi:hypothetical protein GGS23DRAFT_166654 [Durotheca rogersii]|uniref:uncharacterized protein n=1 Tax=Durotheca rogersii TaxID=419775 RepID=UPI00221FB7E7|nr:uncharacterized protein GGS23DRAFT_166654 [Durotheca rogersii]KAI5867228.1 hypothetical protein GGS23DRAFT_166654 [Durotheca rogersii]